MVLKDKGLLEKEFAKDGLTIRWVLALAPTRRLSSSTPARSTSARRGLGGAARQGQRQPDQVDLRLFAPRVDALVTRKDNHDCEDRRPQGKRVAVTRAPIRTSSWCARCKAWSHREGHLAGAAAASGRQDRLIAATSTPGRASIR